MMIIVNATGDHITGSVNGKPFGVSFDKQKYDEMLRLQQKASQAENMTELKGIVEEFTALTQESYKELVETACPFIFVNKHKNSFHLKYGDKVSKHKLPKGFVDRILKSIEKGIAFDPLIKAFARFLREVPGRPSYTLERGKLFDEYINAPYTDETLVAELQGNQGLHADVAKAHATTTQVAITLEGLLVCYKVSREIFERYELDEDENVKTRSRYGKDIDPDTGEVTLKTPEYVEDRLFEPWVMRQGGDAFLCGDKKGHFIRVGQVHALESWNQVSYPGSKGLHCGGLRYIDGYRNGVNAVTHNILVDPMHIHSIAGLGYGNDGAMTVKQYFVHSSFAGPNRNIYHSSKYAALTDQEYAGLIEEVVKQTEMARQELSEALEGAKALSTVTAESRGGVAPLSANELFGADRV